MQACTHTPDLVVSSNHVYGLQQVMQIVKTPSKLRLQAPAKLLVDVLPPLERSGMSKSSSYFWEVFVEGSLDNADPPPPPEDRCLVKTANII